MSFLEESQHLKIPFGEVESATNKFETLVGKGGFGGVYRGELTLSGGLTTVAVKRLDAKLGQGSKEFSMEIQLLCRYKHPNLISLLGFCDEQNEKALVYEYAERGSLDAYLRANTTYGLTWMQRLKICVGAARGLDYLHNGVAEHYRIIHRDIKSSNILLNGNLEAKISDLGLSKLGIANGNNSILFSNVCGTPGYCDPVYITTGSLTKECDVYSFGVVLFEVLCGRLCWADYKKEDKFLSTQAKEYYKNNKLAEIIDPSLRTRTSEDSLNTFSAIAYKCLHKDQKQRPSMTLVVKELEQALNIQEKYELSKDKDTDYATNKKELRLGIFFDESGKEPQRIVKARNLVAEFDGKAKMARTDPNHKNIDALLECIRKNIGFCQGKPAAAFTVYKCLVHWKYFENERTSVFDCLNQKICSSFEKEDSYDNFAYWLSNASALLFLIHRSLKQEGPSPVQNLPPRASLFGRLQMGVQYWSSSSTNLDKTAEVEALPQVEAKIPALIFKLQLTANVQNMCRDVCDNLKEELGPLLALCIQAPRVANQLRRSRQPQSKDLLVTHWNGIIDCLNNLLSILKGNYVPPRIVQKIFTRIFSYINVQLFNSILLRRECCSFVFGEYMKDGLAELELQCGLAKEEYAAVVWKELEHIRQAFAFLVIHQKYRISYDELVYELCPILSVQQLYRICTSYWDDKYNLQSVSPDVIVSMRLLMTESSSDDTRSSSFLLNDDISISFCTEDLSIIFQVQDFKDVKPAAQLLENPAFNFLRKV